MFANVRSSAMCILFVRFKKERCGKNLHHLDLSGCLYITDLALQTLSSAMGHIPCHMTEDEGQLAASDGHMTFIDKETTNKDDVCADCKENQKIQVYGSWKQRKANPWRETCEAGQNVGPYLKHANGERMRCTGSNQNGCNVSLDECQKNNDCLQRRCDARNDRNVGLVEHGCMTNRKVNGRRCCYSNSGDDTNVPKYTDDADYESEVDETHDQRFDNGNTEIQDMSWIKQGEDHKSETSEACDVDISLQKNASDKIRCRNQISGECRNDRKKMKNMSDYGEIYTSAQEEDMPADYNAEQSFLPEYILLCELNAETDVYTKTNSVDEVDDSELETIGRRSKGKDKFSSRCLEYLSLSGCYQITNDGLK